MRKKADPIPRYGGSGLPGILAVIIPILIIITASIAGYWASTDGGYDEIKGLASIKCLGCLGLDPVVPGFDGFWIEYPARHNDAGENVSHPAIVHKILDDDDTDLLILFFWTQGCEPCAAQWEEMEKDDIASGEEEGGREGGLYEGMKMISVDANNDKHGFYPAYIPTGNENGVPMTTFIFKANDGTVKWYSHYGRMDIDAVHDMITLILYHEIAHAG
ncbi:MAG: hypothetical protein ACMUIG_07270 [Thermoplasmatota archaeon]